MAEGAAKEIVQGFYREAITERDPTVCIRLLDPGFVHNGEPRGSAGQREVVEGFLAAFPDLEHEILLILGEGDLVAAHQRWSGTQGGPFMGFEPTGKRVVFLSTAVLRVEDYRIVEAWDVIDTGAIVAQLQSPG